MTQHDWSETSFDWKALTEACTFFSINLRRYGRISITSCKEKYGTLRLEYFFWNAHYNEFFNSLLRPGYLFVEHPVWLRHIDMKFAILTQYLGLNWIISQYQRLIFNLVTIRAVKKWPHIQAEMLDDHEFQELLYRSVKNYIGYKDHWIMYPTNQENTDGD